MIFTAQGSAHLRFPMKICVGRGRRIPIWEDPLFLCFLQEKRNGCTYTKRFYARFHSCSLGMNQFRSVPWDLQAKAATWELPSKQGCAGMGSLINSFLRVTLVLSVCRGCLPPGNLPQHPYGAIFSIALQISAIKILSLATFILEYPQTLCKTAHSYLPLGKLIASDRRRKFISL